MKKMRLAAAALLLGCVAPGAMADDNGEGLASAFRFGIKAGVNINELKLNKEAFSSENRSGFTGGVTMQFVAPIINLGCDASVMYTHRGSRISFAGVTLGSEAPVGSQQYDLDANYIEIPVNFRWNLGLPGLEELVCPYLATGPDFSVCISKKGLSEVWERKQFDTSWTFGAGVRLVNRVELGAYYGYGISTVVSGNSSLFPSYDDLDARRDFWTVTAALLF